MFLLIQRCNRKTKCWIEPSNNF